MLSRGPPFVGNPSFDIIWMFFARICWALFASNRLTVMFVCGVKVFFVHGIHEAFGVSIAALVIVYEQLGFAPVQKTSAVFRNSQIVGTLVALERSHLVDARRDRLQRLAAQLKEEHRLVRPLSKVTHL